jgi:hypothetical protein
MLKETSVMVFLCDFTGIGAASQFCRFRLTPVRGEPVAGKIGGEGIGFPIAMINYIAGIEEDGRGWV